MGKLNLFRFFLIVKSFFCRGSEVHAQEVLPFADVGRLSFTRSRVLPPRAPQLFPVIHCVLACVVMV